MEMVQYRWWEIYSEKLCNQGFLVALWLAGLCVEWCRWVYLENFSQSLDSSGFSSLGEEIVFPPVFATHLPWSECKNEFQSKPLSPHVETYMIMLAFCVSSYWRAGGDRGQKKNMSSSPLAIALFAFPFSSSYTFRQLRFSQAPSGISLPNIRWWIGRIFCFFYSILSSFTYSNNWW